MSKLKIGEQVIPIEAGSEHRLLTVSGRETHNHYEFYRVKEIPGALFLSKSLSRIKGRPIPEDDAPAERCEGDSK